jgi:hypothetical protein
VAGQAASRCRIRLFQIMNRLAETLIDTLHTCPIPETTRLGRTLRQWRDQILAYVATGGVKAAARRSTSSSTRPAAYRPRLPQLTQLPTMHPARITRNPAVPTTTHPCLIPKIRLERSRNSQSLDRIMVPGRCPYSLAPRSARVIWSWSGSSTRQISVTLPAVQLSLFGVRKFRSSRDSSNSSPT